MNLATSFCITRYYAEFDNSTLLNYIRTNISPTINEISQEMLYPLNHLINDTPCLYLNAKVAVQVFQQLESIISQTTNGVSITEAVFEHYLAGYAAYNQISETLQDIQDFNIPPDIKTRVYRLPSYTSIVEGCLSNLLRFIAAIIGQVIGKDYASQNKLKNLLEIIETHDFTEIAKYVNVNLRNAINHGKISIRKEDIQDVICFYYEEHHQPCTLNMRLYEFDDVINSTYDMVSGVLLGLSLFINNHIDLLLIDRTNRSYAGFSLLALELSIPTIHCKNIFDTGNDKQINVELEIENTDRGYIGQIAVMAANIVYSHYDNYNMYMISFSNPRMRTGWIRFTNEEIKTMNTDFSKASEELQKAIRRQDCIIFPPSEEKIDLTEIKYFHFPNHITDRYRVSNIRDASLENRKRLRAHLYVGEVTTRNEVLDIINEAIEWLKDVKNPPSPQSPIKYGQIAADSLYINVYKHDMRKSKELLPRNENFICFVDYNETGETSLVNGGLPPSIWNAYHHEKIGKLDIAWRNTEYFTRHIEKVGRNDPCPCGSGKKYKQCCGKAV